MNINISPEAEAELEALRSLYFKPDELIEREDSSGRVITVKLDISRWNSLIQNRLCNCADTDKFKAKLCFVVPYTYPSTSIIQITVQSTEFPESILSEIEQNLQEQLANAADVSVLEVCSLTQELLDGAAGRLPATEVCRCDLESVCAGNYANMCRSELGVAVTNRIDDDEEIVSGQEDTSAAKEINVLQSVPVMYNALFHLDHMRSRQNYIKLIKKWVSELGLCGRLLFAHRFILILMHGPALAIKDYLVRNRTTNVDVDSRGRSCKERMLTVLCDGPAGQATRLTDFEVLEGPLSHGDLEKIFLSCGVHNIYTEFVKSIR